MSNTATDQTEAGLAEDQLELAQFLATLSEAPERGMLPKGVKPQDVPEPFAPEDVDFTTNGWLDRIVQVQAWLWLDAPLSADDGAAAIAEKLFTQLAPDEAGDCYRASPNCIEVTQQGISCLIRRVSLASQVREHFTERLEELDDYAAASKEWLERWQDDSGESSDTGPVTATVATWHIYLIKDRAKEGLLELNPPYQRDFVWSSGESQKLIESILQGIPLPSIILSTPKGEEHYEIVDGKQRLTTILRFIGKHPEALKAVEELAPPQKRGDFETSYKTFFRKYLKGKRELTSFLPFKVKVGAGSPLERLNGKYYYEIENERITVGGKDTTVKQLFMSSNSPYLLPVIIYQETDIRTIHQVFGLYNKQGKHLNPEELRNATYHSIKLTRLLIVLSGDRHGDVDALAPYLDDASRNRLAEAGDLLKDLGFGTLRFKRTKVLSWALSILLHAPAKRGDTFVTPSTATHIDAMLRPLVDGSSLPMSRTSNLKRLATQVLDALDLQSETIDAWAETFRNKKGQASKWEELPVVASLLLNLLLVIGDQAGRLRMNVKSVRELTGSITPLDGAQNSTQWGWVADSVTRVLDHLGVDRAKLGTVCQAEFSHDCPATLAAIAAKFRADEGTG